MKRLTIFVVLLVLIQPVFAEFAMSPGPVDFGNVTVGSTARRGFPIQNRGDQPVMVLPSLDGEIAKIASVSDKTVLLPGDSINVQVHVSMPENAPIGKTYKGRVWIRIEPSTIPGLETTGAIIKQALIKDVYATAAPSPKVAARAVAFPIDKIIIILILAALVILVILKKPIEKKKRKRKKK